MYALARIAMQGPAQAGLLAAGVLLLSLIFPPLMWLSSAIVALSILRKGLLPAAQVIGIALSVHMLVNWWLFSSPFVMWFPLVFSWLPVVIVAVVLRFSVSLTLSFIVATGLGLASVLVIHLGLEDPVSFWLNVLMQALPAERMLGEQGMLAGMSSSDYQLMLTGMAQLMTGAMGLVLLLNAVIGLLIGRWLQAGLYNPGGFAKEFTELRFGKNLAIIALLLFTAAAFTNNALLVSLNMVMLSGFMFQGLAVAHSLVAQQRLHKLWLPSMYVLMILPQVSLLVTCFATIDNWFNFRTPKGATGV